MCDDVQLCNRCVREFLILARTWFTFGLPCKTGCDTKLTRLQHHLHQCTPPTLPSVEQQYLRQVRVLLVLIKCGKYVMQVIIKKC
jgi:hypothetical protein